MNNPQFNLQTIVDSAVMARAPPIDDHHAIADHVRLPISLPLLKRLALLANASTTDYEDKLAAVMKLAGEIAAKSTSSYTAKDVDYGLNLESFLVPSFSQDELKSSPKKLDVNWRAIVIKLHQSLLQAGPYDALLKRIGVIDSMSKNGTSTSPILSASSSLTVSPSTSSSSSSSSSSAVSSPPSSPAPSSSSPITPPSPAPFTLDQTNGIPIKSNGKKSPSPAFSPTIPIIKEPVDKSPNRSRGALNEIFGASSQQKYSPIVSSTPAMTTTTGFNPVQSDSFAFSQPVMMGFNPNNIETDPIILPDGSSYSDSGMSYTKSSSIPISNSSQARGWPVQNNNLNVYQSYITSPSPSSSYQSISPSPSPHGSAPRRTGRRPSVQTNEGFDVPAVLNSADRFSSFGGLGLPPVGARSGRRGSVQGADHGYNKAFAESSGLPPTRLTEALHPPSHSRAPPTHDPTFLISNSTSLSPSPSSYLQSPISSSSSYRNDSFTHPNIFASMRGPALSALVSPVPVVPQVPLLPPSNILMTSTGELTSAAALGGSVSRDRSPASATQFSSYQDSIFDDYYYGSTPSADAPTLSNSNLPSSTSFKPSTVTSGFNVASSTAPGTPMPTPTRDTPDKSSLDLPPSFDIVVSCRPSNGSAPGDGMLIDLASLLVVMSSMGRLDHYLEFILVNFIHKKIVSSSNPKVFEAFSQWAEVRKLGNLKPDTAIYSEAISRFETLKHVWTSKMWTTSTYESYVERIVNSYKPIFGNAIPSESTEEERMIVIMRELEAEMSVLLEVSHFPSLKHIERLGICLLGHSIESVRSRAVRLLNMLYDGHEWQKAQPFRCAIRSIGDAFKVSINMPATGTNLITFARRGSSTTSNISLDNVYLLVSSPPPLRSNVSSSPSQIFTRQRIQYDSSRRTFQCEMPCFSRSGFYDWRLAVLMDDGRFMDVWDAFNGGKSPSGPPAPQTSGRFIVHPPLRDEIIHEVWVDLQDGIWDPSQGLLVRIGSFAALAMGLEAYARDGITTVYVMGALAHESADHPFCPTDRGSPASFLGGDEGFALMMNEAKRLGLKIVVDSTTRLSSHKAHRKYRNLECIGLDDTTAARVIAGTDGEFVWTDCVQGNFRKMKLWDLLVQDIMQWCGRGVAGVRLDGAHTWPLMLRSDREELYRLDSDNMPHYSMQEIIDGDVVIPSTDADKSFGYWETVPSDHKFTAPHYANPFFIKLTRTIWSHFPQFVFLAEIQWNRELTAVTSGLVPYSSSLPRALQSVYEKLLAKDGTVQDIGMRQTVRPFYEYYEMRVATYPPNSIILHPSCTHHTPYPLSIYSPGTWAAVDLVFLLPEIPITYFGEQFGWTSSVDIQSRRCKSGARTPHDMQFQQIQGHYAHRVALRKTHEALRRGGMIPLLCHHEHGWQDRVFAFARFTESELMVIAINFANAEVDFYIDYKPLCDILEKFAGCAPKPLTSTSLRISAADFGGIFSVQDLFNGSNAPQYVTQDEFVHEQQYYTMPAFGSICWNVKHQPESPATLRILYENSLDRLKTNLSSLTDVDDIPSRNHIFTLVSQGLSSVESFSQVLDTILTHLQTSSTSGEALARILQEILFKISRSKHQFRTPSDVQVRILALLECIAKSSTPKISQVSTDILGQNSLGSIVFITPEIGRFSTVGGIGVMLDEFSRSLVSLGCDVHIISPYYNYGKNGKTGYLEKEEGIKWDRNIVTYVGQERIEVGVHSGEDKGVKLHFLHHFDYFPTPYSTGSAEYQLKTIVLMAKASLELLCQIGHLPAVVITNDWFTALVPAYARTGAFGNTFNGVTFFHLVHNLEEAYQGRIYPDKDDLAWIHQLPRDLLVDPYWDGVCLNASRAALLVCNNWGTVSTSYLHDLIRTSVLAPLLNKFPVPFAHSNGIRVVPRREALAKEAASHAEAKEKLQRKYFGWVDPAVPVFSFVGRIVLQKGVHLILNAVRELMTVYNGRIMIMIGGMANMKDPYASNCAWSMQALRKQFPSVFWADPDSFFSDGSLVNYGSDFALMPSLFEPSGVVQQEYFAAGTPVIAFKTGGLKDTVFEFETATSQGNGFTFEAHRHSDFVQAVHRAMAIFNDRSMYVKLRDNAYNSVLDCNVVADAWAREFSRMRKCIWADSDQVKQLVAQLLEKPVIQAKQ